jgi:hypothetical protein
LGTPQTTDAISPARRLRRHPRSPHRNRGSCRLLRYWRPSLEPQRVDGLDELRASELGLLEHDDGFAVLQARVCQLDSARLGLLNDGENWSVPDNVTSREETRRMYGADLAACWRSPKPRKSELADAAGPRW